MIDEFNSVLQTLENGGNPTSEYIKNTAMYTTNVHYNARNLDLNKCVIKATKVVARIKICGGGLTFTIMDYMQFEMPTKEQCENLKKTFGIEVELVNEI